MRPLLSVIVPTNRVGGLDLLFESLAAQTFTDFELCLSDGIYKHRSALVAQRAAGYRFPVKHIDPCGQFPLTEFCRTENAAIDVAIGQVAVFLADYTWCPPDLLATHAAFHIQHRPSGFMLPQDYYEIPALHPSFQPYGQGDVDRYVADLEAGHLERVMWSIFADPIRRDRLVGFWPDRAGYAGADPKLKSELAELPVGDRQMYFHAKNESVPLAAIRSIDGFDENLDGTNGYQDSDFADRLTVKAGIQWFGARTPIAQILNPRPVFPFPRRPRPVEDNFCRWQTSKQAGYPPWKSRKLAG